MSDTSEDTAPPASAEDTVEKQSTVNQALANALVFIGRVLGWSIVVLCFLAIIGFLMNVMNLQTILTKVGSLIDFMDLQTTLIVVGLAVAYLGKYLMIAQSPDIVRVFRLDRYIGYKGSGWYFGFPFFLSFGIVSRSWTKVPFADDFIPLKRAGEDEPNEYCHARGMIQIRPGADPRSLELSLAMNLSDMLDQAAGIAVSELHKVCGGMTLDDSIQQFSNVSEGVREPMENACRSFGYDRQGFRLDIDYKTAQTRADGAARGYAAERLSKPLKKNYPAALVAGIQTIMDGLPLALGKKPKSSDDPRSGQGDVVLGREMLEDFAAKLGVGKET